MSNRLVFGIVTVATAVVAALPLTAASAAQREPSHGVAKATAADWGPVEELWDHRPDDQSLEVALTSDGTSYAAWRGLVDLHQYVAVKAHGRPWSRPLLVGDTRQGPLTTLIPIGRRIVVIWPGTSAMQSRAVYPDGSMGPVTRIADFDALPVTPCVDCKTAAGDGRGGLVAVWSEGSDTQAFLSYRPAGGGWSNKERVPVAGFVRDVVLATDGTATLLVSQGGYDNYGTLVTVDRSADGQWGRPFVVARATAPTYLQSPQLIGNSSGVQAVEWELGPKWFATTLRARYRPAGGAFGPAHTFTDKLEYYSSRFTVDATGQVDAVYEEKAQGSLHVLVTRHPAGGGWATPKIVDTIGDLWDIQLALNDAGDFVVGAKSFGKGVHLVRCPRAGACDAVDRHQDVGVYAPQVGYGPNGRITLFWGSGCKGDVCQSQRLMTQVSAANG